MIAKPKADESGDIQGNLETSVAASLSISATQITKQRINLLIELGEFLVRFLTTEAIRLGHALDSFMAQCPDVVKSTTQVWSYSVLINSNALQVHQDHSLIVKPVSAVGTQATISFKGQHATQSRRFISMGRSMGEKEVSRGI